MLQFKEPKPNLLVIALCKMVFPLWMRLKEHLSICVLGRKQDLQAFSKSRRALVLLNHPDRQDAFVPFQLSRQMHENFYCIAARECFDWHGGLLGWLFQRLGCYSIMRGKTDFHSIARTKRILFEGRRKLLVFPEAEITGDYWKLKNLNKAIFHIALAVQQDLSKSDASNLANHVSIFPAAIKFQLKGKLSSAVEPSLRKIEKHLGLKEHNHQDLNLRLTSVIDAYFQLVFDSYGFKKPQDFSVNLAELAAVQIMRKIALRLGLKCDESIPPVERLYAFRVEAAEQTKEPSVAQVPHKFKCMGISKPCIGSDLERVERLLVVQRMLQHPMCDIEYCRILDFLESELFESISPKGWQSCEVILGAPIDVSPFLGTFVESKEEGVQLLSDFFSTKLQSMLQADRLSLGKSI